MRTLSDSAPSRLLRFGLSSGNILEVCVAKDSMSALLRLFVAWQDAFMVTTQMDE